MLSDAFYTRSPSFGVGDLCRRWRLLLTIAAGYASVAMAIYLAAGLGEWSPNFWPVWRSLALCLGFFVLPSLLEELVWRWVLIPPDCLGRFDSRTATRVLASALVFTAAHPVAGLLFVPHARQLFTSPAFLVIVFLLGLTCGALYVISKSIWSPVVIHWATVITWKFLLGGPFVLLGR